MTTSFDTAVRSQEMNVNDDSLREADTNGRTPLVNIAVELRSGLNKSSIVRASNAFLARYTVFFDDEPIIDVPNDLAFNTTSLKNIIQDLRAEGYCVLAVDNLPEFNPVNIYDAEIPFKTAFVYGREGEGLYREELELCDGLVEIPMPGPARSFNVAQAAAIAMGEYTRRHRFTV